MEEMKLDETITLVRAVNHGDDTALDDLLRRYRPRIQQIVALRMGKELQRYVEDEDVVQEVLVDLFRSQEKIPCDSQGAFRNWLATLVENRIRDRVRYEHRAKRGGGQVHRAADQTGSILIDALLPQMKETPSQLAGANELEMRLLDTLHTMSTKYRKVIELRQLCGMSYEEVAQEMDLGKADNARALFNRAMIKLMTSFDDGEESAD